MPVSSPTEHWIRPDALVINLNHFGNPDYLQVSTLAGAVVMAFKQDVINYNAARNYRTWPLEAANTYLENPGVKFVYARVTRSEVKPEGKIIYENVLRDIEGRTITYESGSEINGEPDTEYFYLYLGQISASINEDGRKVNREWIESIRFGNLNTNQHQDEKAKGDWEKMFRLNKVFDMIEPLKEFLTGTFRTLFIDGKEIKSLQRSLEVDEKKEADDKFIPTTKFVEETYLRKDVDDRSKGKIATDKAIEVGNYVSGASGATIYKDEITGQTVGEVDKLYVRMKAYFETLEIINVNTIGGKQILSPAGSVKCIGVDTLDNAYRCYFLAEQDGEKINNRFLAGDQIYSQTFDAVEGTSQNVSNHYFWRLCTAVSSEPIEYEGKMCHYMDLSMTDCDENSDIPIVGDVLNQRGNRTDLDRMNFIEQSSVDAYSPNITLFHGVNSYSLVGKEYVSYGVDKLTNKAFMNVYGDMYVGDRQGGSYMRYTQEGGLEISGTLSVGTKLGDTPLKDLIAASTPEGYQEFVEKVTQDIEGLQNQIDGAIDSYSHQYEPTLGNYPASEWTTEDLKKAHLNDTFTNLVDGRSWRWALDGSTYKWVEITDTATTQALALAGQAKDMADGKRRVFVDTPKPPYDLGDLWSRGSDYPLMICVVSKASGVYEESDFDYADNTEKLREEMTNLVNTTKAGLDSSISSTKAAMEDYTDDAKKALQQSIDLLEETKAEVDNVYSIADADAKISAAEAAAIKKAEELADAARDLAEKNVQAWADGEITEAEQRAIDEAQARVDAAKRELEEAIDAIDTKYAKLVADTKDELNNAIGQAKNEAVNNANKYTDEGKAALQASINELDKAKAGIESVYTKSEADGKISEAEEAAIAAAKKQADAAIALSETTIKAYADGIVDGEEAARIKQAQENLEAAKKYAEEKAQEVENEIKGSYLFKALTEAPSTEIDNGLVLTSLIQLRDTESIVMSGINGLMSDNKGDKSIATWWGGNMLDLTDYYEWDGSEWVVKSGVSVPSNIPSGLIRMDGTGYLAKGKFWWDESGKIYADPTALFLMFDVEDESLSLSQTILAMRDKQTEFNAMWAFKTDTNGQKYLYTTYPLVTQAGVTMFGGTDVNVPSVFDSLPIDGTTIYWDNGILKASGGGGGGSIDYPLSWSGFSSGSFDGSAAKTIYIPSKLSELTNDSGYAFSSALSGYLPITGGTITGNQLKIGQGLKNSTYTWILKNASASTDYGTIIRDYRTIDGTQKFNGLLINSNGLYYQNGVGDYKILDVSNYSSYALPITGGSIKSSDIGLHIKRTSGHPKIAFYIDEILKGYIGYNADGNPIIHSASGNEQTIYHSGNFTPSNYLPLSGGTMNAGSSIQWAAQNSKTAYIGQYATDGSLLISIEGKSTNNGLVLGGSSGNLLYKGVIVLHATNYAQYALPLTGGVLTGNIYFGNASTGSNTTAQGSRFPSHLYRNVFDTSGNVYDHYYNAEYTASTCTFANLRVKNGSSYNTLRFGGDGTFTWNGNNVLHSGNYSSYALPLTGGTLKNTSTTFLTMDSTAVECGIAFKINSASKGWVGYSTNRGTCLYSYGSADYFGINDNGSLYYSKGTVWHSGNDGAGSGLDADLFHGRNPYHYPRAMNSVDWDLNTHVPTTCNTFSIRVGGSNPNLPPQGAYGNLLNVQGLYSDTSFQLFGSYSVRRLFFRSGVPGYDKNGLTTAWKEVAFIDSNVASATKLQTARTIWGQSFDGTGNISGHLKMSNNTNIQWYNTEGTAKNLIFLSNNNNFHIGYGAATSTYNTYLDGYNVYLRYGTAPTAGMMLQSGGNVGIGTTSPAYKLDVAGTFNASSNAKIGGSLSVSGSATFSSTLYAQQGVTIANNRIISSYDTDGTSRNVFALDSDNNFVLGNGTAVAGYNTYLSGNAVYIRYGTSRTTGLTLGSDGAVSIAKTLSVRESSTFTGKTTHNGGIASTTGSFSGALTASSTLSVSSTSTFTGNTTNKAIAYFANGTTYYVNASGAAKFASLTSAGAIKGTSGSFSSTLAVTSTSTFTGKTTHNGGLESTVSSAYAIYGNSSTARVCIAGDSGKAMWIGSTSNSASNYIVSVNYGLSSPSAGSGGYNAFVIRGDGNVGIGQNSPSAKLHVAGNILCTGQITMNSMRSMKNIIGEKVLSLSELSIIKPTRFTWKDGRDDRIHVGGIADDVMNVLPEVIVKGSDGVLSMDYASASFVMAASLTKHVSEHERKIANLERENALLKEEIERLKRA